MSLTSSNHSSVFQLCQVEVLVAVVEQTMVPVPNLLSQVMETCKTLLEAMVAEVES